MFRSIRRVGLFVAGMMFVLSGVVQSGLAHAGSVYVHGYVRSNGTYVLPHYRSSPDGNFSNNWSTRGNVNPYTGAVGTRSYPSSGYGSSYYPMIYRPIVPSVSSISRPTSSSWTWPSSIPAKSSYSSDNDSDDAAAPDDDE